MARDTADDWKIIGETEPWWGVLSAPEFLCANITEEAKERFYAQGRAEMDWVTGTLRKHFPPFKPQIAIDFGSGLGRLAFPMASICNQVYGVDISPGMRSEANKQANALQITNVQFVEEVPTSISADWVNSFIVFQHILPRTGYEIIERLLRSLVAGGYLSIQLTFAHDHRNRAMLNRDLSSWRFDGETITVLKTEDHRTGEQSMYCYDLNRVLMVMTCNGLRDILLRHTDHGGAHGFWFFGQKN